MIHSTMGYNGMYLVEFDPDVTIICRQLVYMGNQPIYFMLVNYHSLPRYGYPFNLLRHLQMPKMLHVWSVYIQKKRQRLVK